jgi:glucose/arabinose dehydrogenase
MLSSSFLRRFFTLIVFLTVFYEHGTHGVNVTFVPQPISYTLADLPEPYATPSVSKGSRVVPIPENPILYVPDGFTVKVYMSGLSTPRYLLYTPTGDILVSEPRDNRISCLVDNDGDGYPDERLTFADASNGLNHPYGMAFLGEYFYVGNQNATRRYTWISGSRYINGTGEEVMTYDQNGHRTRTVVVAPTLDRIYVSIGSGSNVDEEALPRASVQLANLDGSNQTTFAYGLRNPVGLAFHPITQDLYVSCQERDELGDDLVPDYFTRIEQDEFYGWPYAYLSSGLVEPRRRFQNGTSERPDLVAITRTPDVLFESHSAVLDMLFYTGGQFPTKYQNGAFAAFHGSWNRNNGTGSKVVFIPFNDSTNRPMGYYEDFITGFLVNPQGPDTFGRPVGLLVLKDGSLLFTEDGNSQIYQVQYNNNMNDTTTSTTSFTTTTTGTTSITTTTTTTNNSERFVLTSLFLICNLLFSFFVCS